MNIRHVGSTAFSSAPRTQTKFPGLATSGRHDSAMITDRQKFTSKWCLYGMFGFHFCRYNQFKVFPLGCMFRTNGIYQTFGNVQCPILCIKTNCTPQWIWVMVRPSERKILKKSKLNWKLKISNTADNPRLASLSRRNVTLGIVECRN